MQNIFFPYGKGGVSHTFDRDVTLLCSELSQYTAKKSGAELIEDALCNPIGSLPLHTLAQGKQNIVLIASDHTRPVPSKLIVPPMLREIRRGNPDANITILIATGCHRETSKEELVQKFGAEIVERENIVIHDCADRENLIFLGTLPSGGECEINRIAANADLLVSEGFIEPHFFAGFSGGRKSVLPGIAGRNTVLANHCAEFIESEYARTGILDRNPIHEDMLWAAKEAKLAFIVNVVLDGEKNVIYAAAGDMQAAHADGVRFLSSLCDVTACEHDVVITTNGGYPLDQNLYQAVKGMTAAETVVKRGGVIIMLAASNDGMGGEHFYHQLADEPDLSKTLALFRSRARSETVPDQWQSQIFIRVLQHSHVIYISELSDEQVQKMHMTPAHSIDEALGIAGNILNRDDYSCAIIPDGVSVIVKKEL